MIEYDSIYEVGKTNHTRNRNNYLNPCLIPYETYMLILIIYYIPF